MNSILFGGLLSFFASLTYPIIRFLFPPEREPDRVVLNYEDYQDMSPYTSRMFAWGNKPGILVKKTNDFEAFNAICTHLDCTVTFLAQKKMFYCACHNGWYDEDGVNVAGPPPSPLRRLGLTIEEGKLIIFNEGTGNYNKDS